MTLLLLLAQRRGPDPDWIQYVFVAAFVLLPLIGRVLRSIFGHKQPGSVPEKARPGAQRRTRGAPPRAGTGAGDGEDLWRRLLRGEEVVRTEVKVEEPQPQSILLPSARPRLSAPLFVPPSSAPLGVMGEVREAGAVGALSLESEGDPTAIGALDRESSEPRATPALMALDARGLRHAMLVSEILGPPVSLRGP